MNWVIRIVGGLLLVLVLVIVAAPMLISKDALTQTAQEQATAALGREVQIGAVTQVSLLPPRLGLEKLSVANAAGFDGPALVQVDKAQLAVKLFPLFGGRVEIEQFVLDTPQISLQTKADGSNNFTLGAPSEETKAEGQPGQATATGPAAAKAAVVGTILIKDGSVRYQDPTASYAAEEVNVSLVLPPLGSPLKLDLDMALEGIPVDVSLQVEDPWRVTETNSVAADLQVDVAGNTLAGKMDAVTSPLTLSGPISIELANLAGLEPLLGAETLAGVEPFGGISIDGMAELDAENAGFRGANYKTAIASGTGDFVVALATERPKLTGTLTADVVDLRPFMPPADESAEPSEDAAFPPWSEEAIDLSGLRGVDADLQVQAREVTMPSYSLTNVKADVTAVAGLVTLNLQDARAFDGQAKGQVRLDARPATARVNTRFEFAGVDFSKAAPALLGTDKLTGVGGFNMALTTQGNSQAAWVKNLDGNVAVEMTGGSILGVDLNAIANSGIGLVDGLRSGQGLATSLGPSFSTLTTNAVAEDAKTLFDLANMTIALDDGVSSFGKAQLSSDTFRAAISGGANLPKQSMDMAILLAAKAPEAAGYRELKAPVKITGTFNEPKITVDTGPIVAELTRGAAKDALGKIGVDVGEDQSIEDTLRDKAKSEILNLFGSRKKKGDDKKDQDPPNED